MTEIVDFTKKPAESLQLWRQHHSDEEIRERIMVIRPQMGEWYQRYLNQILDLMGEK